MKPFDLEAAKRGAPLVTRDGRAVSEFHVFETEESDKPCVAVVDGRPFWTTRSGKYGGDYEESEKDLFMASHKRTVYVNLYKRGACYHFPTEQEARAHHNYIAPDLAVAVPVEIEG
ncbi:hypothetical protein [Burkholderia multivorans]|uniref:hypothetical protein n=1 Tax=Burkholderia multivorans TaxID=87883 RepID=UPI0021BE36B8|nr:hypothetical protein [Burkholderia multivorans]